MAQWLVKEEPEHYSYDQLVKEKKTVWAGVRNPLAQKHLRSISKGDRIFYYHTGKEKAIVAVASAATPTAGCNMLQYGARPGAYRRAMTPSSRSDAPRAARGWRDSSTCSTCRMPTPSRTSR